MTADLSGNVWAAAQSWSNIYVACGDAGLAVLSQDMQEINRISTEESVKDVKIHGSLMFTAESSSGCGIYDISGAPRLLAYVKHKPNAYYSSVAVSEDGRLLIAQDKSNGFAVFNISNVNNPVSLERQRKQGASYFRNVFSAPDAVGIAGSNGIQIFHLTDTGELLEVQMPNPRYGERNGTVWTGEKYVQITQGYLTYTEESGSESPIDVYKDSEISGKPGFCGNILTVSNANTNQLFIMDVTNMENPSLIEVLDLDGRPDAAFVTSDYEILVPCHYRGLVRLTPKG